MRSQEKRWQGCDKANSRKYVDENKR